MGSWWTDTFACQDARGRKAQADHGGDGPEDIVSGALVAVVITAQMTWIRIGFTRYAG